MGKADIKFELDERQQELLRASGVDLETLTRQTVDRILAELVARAAAATDAAAWAAENAEALKAHRERIEAYGVFGEDLRSW